MKASPLEQRIEETLAPSLESMGYRIVQVKLQENARSRVLSILAERRDGQGMTVDDCADISGRASAILDVEDPIQGAYQLEVASPGIDRPLTSAEDFSRFAGHEAKLEAMLPVQGRKRWRGEIAGVENDEVKILVDGVEWRIALSNLRAAKLVLTDRLIDETLRAQAAAKANITNKAN